MKVPKTGAAAPPTQYFQLGDHQFPVGELMTHTVRAVHPDTAGIIARKVSDAQQGVHLYVPDIQAVGLWPDQPGQPRFTKRLSQYVYKKLGVTLPNDLLAEVGQVFYERVISTELYWRLSPYMDWEPGDFGDHRSCFFGDRRMARPAFERAGAMLVKFYKDAAETRLGRCYLLPLPRHRWLVFNFYAVSNIADIPTPLMAAQLLAGVAGLGVTKYLVGDCSSPSGEWLSHIWYNNNIGYLLGDPYPDDLLKAEAENCVVYPLKESLKIRLTPTNYGFCVECARRAATYKEGLCESCIAELEYEIRCDGCGVSVLSGQYTLVGEQHLCVACADERTVVFGSDADSGEKTFWGQRILRSDAVIRPALFSDGSVRNLWVTEDFLTPINALFLGEVYAYQIRGEPHTVDSTRLYRIDGNSEVYAIQNVTALRLPLSSTKWVFVPVTEALDYVRRKQIYWERVDMDLYLSLCCLHAGLPANWHRDNSTPLFDISELENSL
jgi:hypothetical protein